MAPRKKSLPASKADYSILRFAFQPLGTNQSDKPPWQDPDYGTAVALDEASRKLLLAVDAFDVIFGAGKVPPDRGFKIEVVGSQYAIRLIAPGLPANKAGLLVGDIITSMNRLATKTPVEYLAGRAELASTGRLKIGVRRTEQQLDVELIAV